MPVKKNPEAELKPKRVYKKRVPKISTVEDVTPIIDEVIETNEIIIKYPTDCKFDKVHEIEFPELKEKVKNLLNLK